MNKIQYPSLNSKQKENYNFHKVSAVLADYGFNSLRLNDDWNGADFIAVHIDGSITLKVQLKSRLWINRKYEGKNLYIAFPNKGNWYLYSHDVLMKELLDAGNATGSKSWDTHGAYSWGHIAKNKSGILEKYKL